MRICYIGDGESVHNHFMIDWFVKHKHEVVFLTDTPVEGIHCEVHQVAPKERGGVMRHWRASRHVKKFIKKWKPDIVHAHNVTGYGYWGALCGFHPFFLTAWGSDLMIEVHRNAMVRTMVRYSLRKADVITADAKSLCETADDLSRNNADIRELQWGVHLKEFDHEVDAEVRAKFHQQEEYLFISNRRLRPIYNIDVIVRAFARALPQMRGSRLLVIGEDEMSDDLRRLAAHVCADEFITFTGWLDRKDMVDA
ncbi:glycosyltransferase, partial [bacterium]|nr:glycosyltransferase [bacterium]